MTYKQSQIERLDDPESEQAVVKFSKWRNKMPIHVLFLWDCMAGTHSEHSK